MIRSLSLILIAVTLTACQTKTTPKLEPAQGTSSAYQGNVSLLVKAGEPTAEGIPNFTWYDGSGKEVSFAEFSQGKPVLINFWATWCGPCVRETPDLVELYHELKSQGALFIGVSADLGDDAKDLVTEFTAKFKVPYQVVIDNNGELQQALGGLRGYPTTYYVDKNGKIVKKLLGMQSKQKFAEEFKAIL
jgi:thiol-disulfide isomerase/thioredoxin